MKMRFYNTIRFKFIVAFTAVMLLSFSLSYIININVIHKGINDTAKHQFSSALNLIDNFIDFVGQTSQIWIQHIKNNRQLSQLIVDGKQKQLKKTLDYERHSIAADTIILLNKKGIVIAQSGSNREINDSLTSLKIIKDIINNKHQAKTSITRERNNFIIYSSGILLDRQEKLQGILLIGYYISEEFLDGIKKNTQIDLAIVGNSAIMGSTKWADKEYLNELPLPYLSYQRLLDNRLFSNIRFLGHEYLIAAKKLKYIESSFSGSILMAVPAEQFTIIERNINTEMAKVFVFLSILVIIIVFSLSHSFLKSINQLNSFSSGFAKGLLNSRIRLKSGDEFQLLAENFNNMAQEIEKKNHLLQQLNLTLESRVKEELQKGREKDKLLLMQSRHAAMGEMISMIAHQWRQPLSVIAMSANNILADIEFEQVDLQSLELEAQAMIKQTRYLSNTIDDFRSFFQQDKKKELIKIETIFENSFEIIGKALENNNINVICHYNNNPKIMLFSHESLQVFLNILKNAQEVLIENRKSGREITINIQEIDSYVETIICDNAGGIAEDILSKIFEPYFSTKMKKNGTGLGLYMSKIIVEQHLGGKISAYNTTSKNEKIACFKILFPNNQQQGENQDD
ncbi:MAG: ATP-binding protein [Pseudomonadota bacterium]